MLQFRPRLWINRLLRNGRGGYLLILFLVLVFLACIVALASQIEKDVWWVTYYTLGIPPVDRAIHGHLWLYLLLGVSGALVFGGVMITVFVSGVERYVERVRDGLVRYRNLRGHVVIIGWTPITIGLIEQVCKKHPHARVLLLSPQHPSLIHTEMEASLSSEEKRRTIVYASGEGGIRQQLASLCLDQAVELYITLDESEMSPQPITQFTLIEDIARTVIRRRTPLRVNVMIDDIETYTTFQRIDIPENYYGKDGKERTLDIRLFNFYENWARLLWGYGGGDRYDPLDFEPLEEGKKHVHLVIVGFGNMGKALFLESLRVCHYPTNNPTLITIVDIDADKHYDRLCMQIPYLKNIKDIKIDFLADRIESDNIQGLLKKWGDDEDKLLSIAVCLPTPAESLQSALNLPENIFCNSRHITTEPFKNGRHQLVRNSTRTRVFVQQTVLHLPGVIVDANRYPHLQFFGTLLPEGATVDLLDDRLAIIINGLYHDNLFRKVQDINIGNHMSRWMDLWLDSAITPESSKHASRYQSDLFRSTINVLKRHDLSEDNDLLEMLAECEHRRWIAERTLMNWRSLKDGEHRVDILRRHDCIIPYDELSDEEKQKDRNVIQFAKRIATVGSIQSIMSNLGQNGC